MTESDRLPGRFSLDEWLTENSLSMTAPELPESVRRTATHCVLDWLGAALAGSRDPVATVLRGALADGPSGTGVTLLGGGRANERDAALFNGTCGHVLDFDDVAPAMSGHPTAPLLPALLAVAEVADASGADLLVAFVVGYELENWLGIALGPGHYAMGFHATATLGTFGAAAGCAKLLGLEREQWLNMLGIASTSAAGLKSAFGTMTKSLQVGNAAANGISAARLAAAGATGPTAGIECEQGFGETHSPTFNGAVPHDSAGRWHIRDVLFKYHASCYLTHSSIEGVRSALRRSGAEWQDVESISLRVNPGHLSVCNIPAPKTPLEAKFSLRFTAAMAAVDGRTGAADFTKDLLADRRINALAQRVEVLEDETRPSYATEVTLTRMDGMTTTEVVDVSQPTPESALDDEESRLVEKFHALADPVLGTKRAAELREVVLNLEDLGSVRNLLALCT